MLKVTVCIFFILKTNDIPVTQNQYFYCTFLQASGVQRDFILERIHARLKYSKR